jgi:hypothetical protein
LGENGENSKKSVCYFWGQRGWFWVGERVDSKLKSQNEITSEKFLLQSQLNGYLRKLDARLETLVRAQRQLAELYKRIVIDEKQP